MKRLVVTLGLVVAAVAAGLLFADSQAGAQSGASSPATTTPRFSEFASADDLTYELNFLIADAEKAVADKDEYDSQIENRFGRDADTIALVATALALYDDNPVKAHAPAIVAAAGKLREAKGYEATKKAVEDLKASLEGNGGGELHWGKVAPFKSLMKDETANINTKLKTGVDHIVKRPGKDVKKRTKDAAANAAMLALIAENAKLYLADTKKPTDSQQWNAFADQLRTAAADVAAKVHAGDKAGIEAGMDKLNQSCHDCHAVFHPEANEAK